MKKLIVLAIGALALLPVANATSSRTTARIAITDLAPFTIYGSGFSSHERVRVTVVAKARVARAIVATAGGTFNVRFATVRLERCASYTVRAVGSNGSVVTKKVMPECPQPAANNGGTGDPDVLYPTDPTPKHK